MLRRITIHRIDPARLERHITSTGTIEGRVRRMMAITRHLHWTAAAILRQRAAPLPLDLMLWDRRN